jgi:hypothetical protein
MTNKRHAHPLKIGKPRFSQFTCRFYCGRRLYGARSYIDVNISSLIKKVYFLFDYNHPSNSYIIICLKSVKINTT